ncbi:hypothetical protein FR483_n738R [Paramecium bursaria Chlorella virus FR483]|uniref:Uncharacterized protein n738R n=1 Tax=Paramecium bursaria Chlorella virus FR483 TaxID=399781 RepID=A7J892_PBCVF|nr:hypothetical protein FR483_n738R [Paramecium bursaria Chlorella virus FR483]ABT16023.1 hypothetical protein FR483_n738R [Paramecium bursaria Chlorella virus FR483]
MLNLGHPNALRGVEENVIAVQLEVRDTQRVGTNHRSQTRHGIIAPNTVEIIIDVKVELEIVITQSHKGHILTGVQVVTELQRNVVCPTPCLSHIPIVIVVRRIVPANHLVIALQMLRSLGELRPNVPPL